MTCSTSATSKPPRAIHNSGPNRCSAAEYSLILFGASNIWRLPNTWTIRKAIMARPVTAITAFFPTDECQKRTTAAVGAVGSVVAAAVAVICNDDEGLER